MCGICGAFSFKRSEITDHIRSLIPLMARRGPDDQGYWRDGRLCALGFRRLAIQDLSPAGHQPMLTEDSRYALVFNGELYNFRELREELETLGARFRSTGDAEVVLYALAAWGRGALDRFNGMFALAFYDSHEKKLLLARDHAGIKPLYYMELPEGLVFASQYDQILAHPYSRRLEVAESSLGAYLRLAYIPAPFALLSNTFQLEAGSWVEFDHSGRKSEGYFFTFPLLRAPDLFGDDAYDMVDSTLTRAVNRQLISDVPVGTFLSGGIDSPLVASKISASGNDSIKAFTIGTNGDKFDESTDAMAYAREIGIQHVVEQVTPRMALDMLDDVVDACGEPFGDFSIFPTMLVTAMARKEVTVMLSGDGGDELFWGYAKRFAQVISSAEDFSAPLLWRKARWAFKKYLGIGDGYYNLCFSSIGNWYRTKHTLLHEDWLDRVFIKKPPLPDPFLLYGYEGHDRNETAQWVRWNEFVGRMTMILAKVDRASMYNSLEVRVPLLDREVVDVASRIDWRSCLDVERRMGKLPLRNSLKRHLNYQTTSKKGFTVPMDDWLRGPLKSVFEDTLLSRTELLGLPLRKNELAKIFKAFLEDRIEGAWGLWLLLSLALWENRHYRAN